jgi:proteasome activator subunit 4
MDYGRPLERMAILDKDLVDAIAPATQDVEEQITQKRKNLNNKRALIEKKKAALANELVNLARVSHW